MRSDVKLWLDFADENLKSAEVLLKSQLYNACLQNVQQAIEKYLKATLISKGEKIIKTHNTRELVDRLSKLNIEIDISVDDCELIDAIYLPTKYPIGSALPDFTPDDKIAGKCIAIAMRVKQSVDDLIERTI